MFQSGGAVLVKISSSDITKTIAAIETAWKKALIRISLYNTLSWMRTSGNYFLLMYTQAIIRFFLLLRQSLFPSQDYLLWQLFLSIAEQRKLAYEKILGAGIGTLGVYLEKFFRLVIIAVVIAIPLSWMAAEKWLQNFVYRTSVGWVTILTGATALICIAILTMSIQTIKQP